MAALRKAYTAHVATILGLMGVTSAGPRAARHRRSRDAHGQGARDADAVGGRWPAAGVDARRLPGQGPGPRLAGVLRGRRPAGRAGLHRLASSRGDRPCRARRKRPPRYLEGLARVPHRQPRHRRPAQGVLRRKLRLLRQDAERRAGAAPALAARRRCDQHRARRGRRPPLRRAAFSGRGQGQGARHGRRPDQGLRPPHRRADVDDAGDQGQGQGQGGDALRRRRLPGHVDRLRRPADRQGRRHRQRRSGPSCSSTAGSSPSWRSRSTAPSGG